MQGLEFLMRGIWRRSGPRVQESQEAALSNESVHDLEDHLANRRRSLRGRVELSEGADHTAV